MGDMHETITARKLCDMTATDADTMRMRFAKLRKTKPDVFPMAWRIDGELSKEQITALVAAGERKGGAIKQNDLTGAEPEKIKVGRPERGPSNEAAPETVTKQKPDLRALFFQIVCVLIVVFHAGLIAYDVAFLWGVPGMIAGGLAFLTVIATLIICTDKKQEDVSQDMVWFVWLIDAAAGVVHFRTFNFAVSVKGGMGVERIETIAFAVFTCLFSAAALYFFRASQFKQQHGTETKNSN